jgi:tRNA threonylcarbamoyladenosine biosynthesis protein TsaE
MKQGWEGRVTSSAEETIELGRSLSEFIEAGDIMTLDGNLAAGKTTFVKGVLSGLNSKSEVTSPTFTLINVVFPAARLPSKVIMSPASMNSERDLPNSMVSSAEDVTLPSQPCFIILFLSKYPQELSSHP